jgi:hypothetical protein
VVERAFAWLGRYRRMRKDYEYEAAHSEAWIQISTIHMMLRRLMPNTENPEPTFQYPNGREKSRYPDDRAPGWVATRQRPGRQPVRPHSLGGTRPRVPGWARPGGPSASADSAIVAAQLPGLDAELSRQEGWGGA